MNSKLRAKLLAALAGISGMLSYVATIPPSEQDHVVGLLVNVFPIGWRGEIGSICRLIAAIATFYAVYSAAHSGPNTPPANSPQS